MWGPRPVALGAAVVLLLLLSGVRPARGSEDIVVGCGGFVKSDVEINYSLIEVSARPQLAVRPRAGRSTSPGRRGLASGPRRLPPASPIC